MQNSVRLSQHVQMERSLDREDGVMLDQWRFSRGAVLAMLSCLFYLGCSHPNTTCVGGVATVLDERRSFGSIPNEGQIQTSIGKLRYSLSKASIQPGGLKLFDKYLIAFQIDLPSNLNYDTAVAAIRSSLAERFEIQEGIELDLPDGWSRH